MADPVFSIGQGSLLIAGYAAFSFGLTWLFARRYRNTKSQFLVADRSLGGWESAFSIAATWIWAPALFISAQKAHDQGVVGLFWFTVPNILCLIIFASFAKMIRKVMPEGFTLSDYIRSRYSGRVQVLYLIQLGGLAVCSFAVQLLAGGKVISSLTGIPFVWVTISLAAIALAYSAFSGLKASVVTDYAQMILIFAVGFVLVPWVVSRAGGIGAVIEGLGGSTGKHVNLFNADGRDVFYTFGIPVTIGLLAGPFGDQSFWQRAFATEEKAVRGAFVKGALIFGIVPLIMSLLGFVAAGKGWQVADSQLVNLEAVSRLLPTWTLIPFVYMLMSGLVSTLDSNLCAVASMAGHDLLNRNKTPASEPEGDRRVVRYSRWSMFALAIAAIAIANIPDLRILYLFLFYGTLRASTLLPTVMTLLGVKLAERGVFWGIVVSILVGLPVFAYGKFEKITWLVVAGALGTVIASGLIAVLVTRWKASRIEDG